MESMFGIHPSVRQLCGHVVPQRANGACGNEMDRERRGRGVEGQPAVETQWGRSRARQLSTWRLTQVPCGRAKPRPSL